MSSISRLSHPFYFRPLLLWNLVAAANLEFVSVFVGFAQCSDYGLLRKGYRGLTPLCLVICLPIVSHWNSRST